MLYVTSETFTNELIDAIRNKNNTAITKFREKYRNIDVLLIDDIQFIIRKGKQPRKNFSIPSMIFMSNKKQIIISSDKPPKDIVTLEDQTPFPFRMGSDRRHLVSGL